MNPEQKFDIRNMARFGRIVLAGMMGSGKSSVGKTLARLLGWPFIDTDQIIEKRSGKTIAQIFAGEGEVHFRALERELAAELRNAGNCVIATGGGMLLDPENYECLRRDALLVHLRAHLDTLVRRLANTTDRPLLAAEDPRTKLQTLYEQRAAVYEKLPLQVDTDGRTPRAIAQEILAHFLAGQKVLYEGKYHVVSGFNLTGQLDKFVSAAGMSSPLFILIDRKVWNLTRAWLLPILRERLADNFRLEILPIAASERRKSPRMAFRLWEHLLSLEAERSSGIIVIGGGVLTDLGGFVASTYKRGVPLILLPTTLLAQIDAAIGGKTGVNFKETKNMIGTFYPADYTLLDPLFLLTLPARELRSGLAEMIKAAVIADAEYFDFLEANVTAILQRKLNVLLPAMERAAAIKIEIVEQDPYEKTGVRMLLNLGHTWGHAIEALSEYRMRHGEAVAIGMVMAARLAVRRGLCDPSVEARLTRLLRRAHLPVEIPPFKPEEILQKIRQDKKRAHKALRLVLPIKIGRAEIVEQVSDAELHAVFS